MCAAAAGLYQYRKANNWKVSEFLATQLSELSAKPETIAACKMLDWESGTISLPERMKTWKLKLQDGRQITCEAGVEFTRETVLNALQVADGNSGKTAI